MRLLARSALAALAGAAAGLSFEPFHWVVLLPFAVAGVTLLATGAGRLRSAFWLGVVFGTAFMLVLLPWLRVIGVYAWIPLALVEGLFYGLAGLATRAVRRLPGWPVWAASSWVLVEALRAVVPFGGFPWGRLAFATEDTPLAPAFAYVGAAGVTFLVALVGTTVAWISIPRLYRAISRCFRSSADSISSSVRLKPSAKSSRSVGVAIMTTCGMPLYTMATGVSSTIRSCCSAHAPPSHRTASVSSKGPA